LGRFIIGNTVKYFDYVQDGAYLRVTWLDSSRSVWTISSNGEKLVSLHPSGQIWNKKDKTQEYLQEAKNYVISWLKQYKQNISSFDQRYRSARNKAELEAVEAAATKAFNEQSFTLYLKPWWRLIESNNEITQILDNLNKQTTQLMLTLEDTKKNRYRALSIPYYTIVNPERVKALSEDYLNKLIQLTMSYDGISDKLAYFRIDEPPIAFTCHVPDIYLEMVIASQRGRKFILRGVLISQDFIRLEELTPLN